MIVTRELLQRLIDEEFSKAIKTRRKRFEETAFKKATHASVKPAPGENNEQED